MCFGFKKQNITKFQQNSLTLAQLCTCNMRHIAEAVHPQQYKANAANLENTMAFEILCFVATIVKNLPHAVSCHHTLLNIIHFLYFIQTKQKKNTGNTKNDALGQRQSGGELARERFWKIETLEIAQIQKKVANKKL